MGETEAIRKRPHKKPATEKRVRPALETPRDRTMLTMMEAAELIHCSRSQIYRLMQMPQFPKFRVNSMVRIPRAAFLDWIDKHSEGTESDEG